MSFFIPPMNEETGVRIQDLGEYINRGGRWEKSVSNNRLERSPQKKIEL